MVQVRATIHTERSYDKHKAEWAKRLQTFCGWMVYHLLRFSRLLPLQSIKEIRARTRHSERLSIMLGYLANGNGFEDLKFIHATCSQAIGDSFTVRQSDGKWMNIPQYCPQTIQCIAQYIVSNFIWLIQYLVQPFNITPRRSVILCNIYSTILLRLRWSSG